ncbi:hypothetical protein MBOT_11260 [Mycobacterium botniense]|uniref:Uncharacterized protein n=1 Tax=Mycobacterium botniense TaxID=84962 RepID=A0A7I9XUT6_9MYCO|nr:hypothetical protein MBOT_11260 [Mycobacterium botniense]
MKSFRLGAESRAGGVSVAGRGRDPILAIHNGSVPLYASSRENAVGRHASQKALWWDNGP